MNYKKRTGNDLFDHKRKTLHIIE